MIERLLTRPYSATGWYLRLTLLIGQSISLGLTLSLLIITANSLFLVDYGSQALPYVYIVVAVAGSALSYGVGILQRRWSISRMAITTVAGLAVFYSLSWLGVAVLQLRWVSFALIVSFSLVIQIGFIFLGGQAGRLLDLRQIKRHFPQVVAGFVVGFLLGALAIPFLVNFLGGTENVLAVQVAALLLWLAFLVVTGRRFPAELGRTTQNHRAESNQPFIQLLRKPFVLLIFMYQILAAMVSQLSDFFLLAQSAQRYSSSADLAQFFSTFTAGLNITDLVITTLIAGLFLSRFGLGAGLLSNPVIMGMFFAGMIITAPLMGIDSSPFFMLVVVARIASISLTDGTTRASVNTTYQALPAHERVAVQTGAEGIGAPLAQGLVGVILLAFNAIPGLTIFHLVLLAAVVVAAWVLVGWKVFQGYKSSLVKMIRRRTLRDAEFSLEDKSTLEAVDRLLRGDKLFQVRQALDVLEAAEHVSLDGQLVRLARHDQPEIRMEALVRIEKRHAHAAQQVVEGAIKSEGDPQVKGAALRAYSALNEIGVVEMLSSYLQHDQLHLRQAAMVGMLRYGGIAGVLSAGQHLLTLKDSPVPAERILAAQVIEEVGVRQFYQPLLSMLQDEHLEVRKAALAAAARVSHPHLLDLVIPCLSDAATRSSAAAALASFGGDLLPVLEEALAGRGEINKVTLIRLLRAAGDAREERLAACLIKFIDHPDNDIRHQVLAGLKLCGFQADAAALPAVNSVLRREVEQGMRILLASQAIGGREEARMLQRALEGDLEQVRSRIFLLLSFQYDSQTILQAEKRLVAGDETGIALAFETLDVTLRSEAKGLVFPILDPKIQAAKRLEQLAQHFPHHRQPVEEQLQEIILNSSGNWQSEWTRSCAVYAAGMLACQACAPAIESARAAGEEYIAETAAWAQQRLLSVAR